MKTKLALLALVALLVPAAALAQDAAESIGGMPVQHHGRVKPLDTFARVHLLAFYGKRALKEENPEQWLLNVLTTPDGTSGERVFKIRSPETVQALGLPQREERTYSFSEMADAIVPQEKTIQELMNREEEDRSVVENQLVEAYTNVVRYQEISRSVSCLLPLFGVDDAELAESLGVPAGRPFSYRTLIRHTPAINERLSGLGQKAKEEWSEADKELVALVEKSNRLQGDRFAKVFAIVPPESGEAEGQWLAPWQIVGSQDEPPVVRDLLDAWEEFLAAWSASDQAAGLEAAIRVEAATHAMVDDSLLTRLGLEGWYNRIDLFYKSVAFYILGFLLLATSWMFAPKLLRRLALLSLSAGVLLHVAGLVCRMVIMGRAPVSTLYESVVFVGAVAAATGVVVELMRRDGYGVLLGSVAGAILHFVGFGKAADGDTMGMLVAVLNSNFWLATHVVTITIGYGCSLVAGLAGHVYLAVRAFRPQARARLEVLSRNMAGLTLVALFFTLFGTILGGIWADQSWGRFWGWDPKENGALLIVMWQLMLLHGRHTGTFRPAGFAFGLVINNIIVALAWFGVNLLNIGLHTYGFTGSVAMNLGIFCAIELLYGVALYPLARARRRLE